MGLKDGEIILKRAQHNREILKEGFETLPKTLLNFLNKKRER